VVLLVLVNGGGWIALQRLYRVLESDLELRLVTTGRSVAATLSTEDLLILSPRDDTGALDLDFIRSMRDDAYYTRLLQVLERIEKAADLRSISLVLPDGRVVADPDVPYAVGETRPLLEVVDPAEMQRAARGEAVATPLYPVGDVLYKRVYVPLIDENGTVPALLCLEASSDYFVGLKRLRTTLAVLLVVSTAVLVIVSLVLYRLISRLLLTERAASQADRLRSLGTLAAGLAHEIRNPLAIIRLTTEELRAGLGAKENGGRLELGESGASKTSVGSSGAGGKGPGVSVGQVGHVGYVRQVGPGEAAKPAEPAQSTDETSPSALIHDIQGEVTRLESLVEQFLSFARPEASQSALTSGRPAEPVAAVRNVVRLFEKSLRSTRTRLETRFPSAPLPRVFLGEKGLSQVLLNILRNAVEAMPQSGGVITISIQEHPGKREGTGAEASADDKKLGAEKEKEKSRNRPATDPAMKKRTVERSGKGSALPGIEILVEDTGAGMPESVRRQAFEPFYSTREDGTGLGLALAQRLVAAAGGRIELESHPGKGTAVRILLPCVARPPERSS